MNAPDTNLDNVRNRVVGTLVGLVVTGFVFQYIWPERAVRPLRPAPSLEGHPFFMPDLGARPLAIHVF